MTSPRATARAAWRIPLLVGALGALAFLPSLRNGFVYDDGKYVVANPLLASWDWNHLRAILLEPYFGNYHPLHMLAYALERLAFGLNPVGWHAVSVALHAVNAALLCRLLPRFGIPAGVAIAGAAFFAVHPVQAESVAWVSEQKNLLSLLFTLLAVDRYLAARASGRALPLLAAFVAYLAALASKVQAVGLLPFLFALEYLKPAFLPAARGRALVRLLPLALAGGLWLNLAILAHGHAGFIHPYPGGSLFATLLSIGPVLTAYGGNLLWPARLAAEYDLLPAGELPHARLAAAWLLLGVCALAVRRACLRHPDGHIVLGLIWVTGFLLPVLNLVPIGPLLNDRYLYAPLCALGPLVAAAAFELARKAAAFEVRAPRNALAFVTAAVLTALGIASMVRSEVWRDELRLWSDAAATSPASHLARYNLGTIWLERGRVDLAEKELRAAIHADPTRAAPYKNLGVLYYRQRRFGLAAAHFRVGIRIAPANYDLWMSLSAAEAGLGRNIQALAAARRASSLQPEEARPYYVRGILLERVGDPAGAATAFRKFLDLEKGATARRRTAEERLRTLQSRLRTPRREAARGT